MYPTEFVKTQLQLQQSKGAAVRPILSNYINTMYANDIPIQLRYNGPLDCVAKIVRERGPFGLYNGLSTLVVGASYPSYVIL
jgi:hypothetical protein